MTSPHFIHRFAGLSDSVNPYADAPEGGCSVADNAVIRNRDLIESRRGYSSVASASPINAIGWKEGKLLALGWDDPGAGITGQLRYYDFGAGAFTALPMNPGGLPFDRPAGTLGQKTRFVSANKATYFQSRYGLTKVEALSAGVCRPVIQPKNWIGSGLIGNGSNSGLFTGAGFVQWLANNLDTSYRFTICRFGANHELIESEPSDILTVINTTGGTAYVSPHIQNGWMVPPDAFYRIYRVKPAVATGTTQSDERFLVAEINAKSSLVTVDAAGFLSKDFITGVGVFPDQSPDSSIFVPLYTNPFTGTGLATANSPAPLAADMAYFKNRLLLLNTTDVQRLTLKIIGTGTGGINDGDWIYIAGLKFAFTTNVASASTSVVFVTTAGGVAANRETTARQLVAAINARYVSLGIPSAVIASYISTSANDAGQILLQSVVPGAVAFNVQTSSSAGWGTDYTTATASDPNTQVAGLSWSNQLQPEAFPLSNAAIVGDTSSPGQRIIALKEAALIFKQNNNNSNDGLWRWTDDGVTTALQIADPTVRLIAPETAQPLQNFVFALCDAGVLLFTENGQSVNVSHDQIERELLKLIAYVGRDTLANYAFAVPYEIEGQYILCLPEAPNATSCTIQYVYSIRTQTWETWHLPGVIAGSVNPNTGQLVWAMGPVAQAPAGANNLWVERKALDSTDYQDPGFSIACPANGNTATMVFSGDLRTGAQAIAVGDLIDQAQATFYVRQRVKTVTYNSAANQTTIILDAVPTHPWSNAQNISVLKAIQTKLKFLPFHAQAPLTTKEWGNCLLLFRYCDLDWITVEWRNEVYKPDAKLEQISGIVSASAAPLDPFASVGFDTAPWDRPAKDQIVKCTMPQTFAECALLGLTLTLGNALCRWELAGIDVGIDQTASDVVR